MIDLARLISYPDSLRCQETHFRRLKADTMVICKFGHWAHFFVCFFKLQIYILKDTKKIRSYLVSAFRLGFNLSLETLTDLRFSYQAKTRFCVWGGG